MTKPVKFLGLSWGLKPRAFHSQTFKTFHGDLNLEVPIIPQQPRLKPKILSLILGGFPFHINILDVLGKKFK